MPSRRVARLAGRAGAVAGAVLVVLVSWSAPASAHAQLLASSPSPGSLVRTSPPAVVLHFDEPVEIDFGSIEVYDAAGTRVDDGGTHYANASDSAVAIGLPHLPDGAYVVAWRVVSADSHPVHGAFLFSVGTSRGLVRASTLEHALANESGSTAVGVTYFFVRFLAFAGLLTLVGVAGIVLAAAPLAAGSRRIRRVLWWSWWLLFLMTLAGIAIQGPYASDLPLTDVVHTTLAREVLGTRFGRVEELRLVLLAVAAALLVWWRRARPVHRRWLAAGAVLDGVGLLATPGLAGHATTGTAVVWGLLLDLFHLGAAAAWLGGLAVLACVLVGVAPDLGDLDVARTAKRISTIAMVAVVVVVVSGSLQALRQVGSLGELTSTTYGRLLLVKVAVVAVLVALGAVSRTLLRRRTADATTGPTGVPRRRALVRSVAAELVVAGAVLGVTAGLVNAPPAGSIVALPYTQSFTTLGVQVNVIVSPASTGVDNVLHVYVLSTTTGLPRAVPEVDASISFPADHLGPISLPLTLAGVGHYRDRDVTFLFPGTWVLTVTVRTTPIDEQVTPLQVPVR